MAGKGRRSNRYPGSPTAYRLRPPGTQSGGFCAGGKCRLPTTAWNPPERSPGAFVLVESAAYRLPPTTYRLPPPAYRLSEQAARYLDERRILDPELDHFKIARNIKNEQGTRNPSQT